MGTAAVFRWRKVLFGSEISAMNFPVLLFVLVPKLNSVLDFSSLGVML